MQYEKSKQNLSTVGNKWEEECLLLLIEVQVFVGFFGF